VPQLCGLGRRELAEGLGQLLDPAAQGFADRILHGQLDALADFVVGLDAKLSHGSNGPLPDVILFLAPPLVGGEADGVVADFVKEDGKRNRRLGDGGLNPVDGSTIVVVNAPGAAAHAAPPFAHADLEARLHLLDDRGVVTHRPRDIGTAGANCRADSHGASRSFRMARA